MRETIERYLTAIASQEWEVVDECIADAIVRVGPYGDRYTGREEYLTFIAALMPTLAGYRMQIHRISDIGESVAFAELTETVEIDGRPMCTPEVLVFNLDADGRIARVDIFIQTPQG